MIAVDTNILVYAHRKDSAFHAAARSCLKALAEGAERWAIPWPCVHEFLAVTTSPRIFRQPTPLPAAIAQIESWGASPTLRFLGEDEGYLSMLVETLVAGKVVGPSVHEARIAAIARQHAVTELLSADRDFSRFRTLKVRNPL